MRMREQKISSQRIMMSGEKLGAGSSAASLLSTMFEELSQSDSVYNSNSGMQTAVWGPILWTMLHIISFNYPVSPSQNDKISYSIFVESLVHILPCKYCRVNLPENLKCAEYGPHVFESRDTFSRFIHTLHTHVNRMLGKADGPSYASTREQYETYRARCLTKDERKQFNKENGCTQAKKGKKQICKIIVRDME